MNSTTNKRLLRARVLELLNNYIDNMEDMFSNDYWGQDFNMAAAVRGFAGDLLESYSTPEEEEEKLPEYQKEEPTEEELEDGMHRGTPWRIEFEDENKPKEAERGCYVEVVTAPTKAHAMILLKRRNPTMKVKVLSIEEDKGG